MTDDTFRRNNFDLIRLLAALQVALVHASAHLGVSILGGVAELASMFPGVPIFFFVSGFLISKSYETNSLLSEYTTNRVLRIYPALWFCLLATIAALTLTGYLAQSGVNASELMSWTLAQATFVQFFNPDFLRGFGVGVVNGSLWTITVELQFYVLVPLLLGWFRKRNLNEVHVNAILFALTIGFLCINRAYCAADAASESLAYKLVGVSFMPWLYMFLLGVLAQRNFALLHRLLSGKAVSMLAIYLALSVLAQRLNLSGGNEIHPAAFVSLAAVVFSAAYTFPSLAQRLLRRNDISYGVYIYHMPLINLVLYHGGRGDMTGVWIALTATFAFATLSWVFVERPALRLKRHPLNPMRATI